MVDDWAVSGDGHHFWDYGVHLYHFKRLPRLLECDVCHQQARVPSDVSFICRNRHCRNPFQRDSGQYLLWTKYKGYDIWALNEEHLDYLEAFTAAQNRSQYLRFTHSLFATLPAIYRSKKDQEAVLVRLRELRMRIRLGREFQFRN